jgi:hypothetical protein
VRSLELIDRNERVEYERALDRALAASFPASAPPPWTFGVTGAAHVSPIPAAVAPFTQEVVVEEGRSRMVSVFEALGFAMLIPVAILAIGAPIALAARWTIAALAAILN